MAPFDLSTAALLVIDMQNDFCPPDGSLAVPEGRDIIPGINQLLHLPFALKIASRDNHPSDHISFVTSHPGKNLFEKVATTHPDVPDRNFEQVHCVQGSEGAEFVEGLGMDKVDVIISKGQDKTLESYSAFVDVWELFPTKLEQSLRDRKITDLYITGLAEDYCVKWTTLDARKRGFRCVIIEDCTRGVADESVQAARKECKDAGVEYMKSADILKWFL